MKDIEEGPCAQKLWWYHPESMEQAEGAFREHHINPNGGIRKSNEIVSAKHRVQTGVVMWDDSGGLARF